MIYPDSAYAPVFEIYKRIPAHLKEKANSVLSRYTAKFKPGEAPPHLMQRDLENIVANSQSNHTPSNHLQPASIPHISPGEALAAGILLVMAYII